MWKWTGNLYPFGFGLTYTSFAYSGLAISGDGLTAGEVEKGAEILISFTVTNTGTVFGEETAQVYVRDVCASVVKPVKELAGFEKAALQPGESRLIRIPLGRRQLRTLNMQYQWHVEPGDFEVMVGDNAANVLLAGGFRLAE